MRYRLEDVCFIQSGGTPRRGDSRHYNGSIPWAKITDFGNATEGVLNETEEYITQSGLESINNRLFPKGTLLLAIYGSVGKTVITGKEISTNQAILGINPKDKEKLNIKYLKYWFDYNKAFINSQAKGATLNNISLAVVKRQELDLPDIHNQNKIVSVLDRASSLIEKRTKTINLLDKILDATFLQMFGQQNPSFNSWKEVTVETVAKPKKGSMRTGPFGSSLKHEEFLEEGDVAVLGIDNAVDNVFRWKKKRFLSNDRYQTFKQYTVFPRDVIITIMGTIGRSAVIPLDIPKAINTKHLAAITLNEQKCNPYYLAYSIHSNPFVTYQMKSKSRGAVMDGLNLGIIKKLKLKEAPIELQNNFEKIYLKNEMFKATLEKSQVEFDRLFNSILQKVFHGELNFNIDFELDALIRELDIKKDKNDLARIIGDIAYLQRLIDKLNTQEFKEKDLYDKAKHAIFQILSSQDKEELVTQEYSEKAKSMKLALK